MPSEFEEVVDRCQRRVYSYACHLLGNPATAEDVTQDAFIRLWNHWQEIDPARVEGWLTRVTRNLCYDQLRRGRTAGRYVVPTTEEVVDRAADQEPGPAERAEAADFRRRFRAGLEKLSEPSRSALILREVLGYKYDEIAEALEIPLNTVRVYLHRSRRRLREELAEVYSHDG